jgi:hypothetical protein
MWDNGGGFEEFSTRCQISSYGDLDSHDIATCEMWGRSIGTILINAIGTGAITLWDC